MRARTWVLGIALACASYSGSARAQTDEAAYREVITEAVQEFDAHRFEEARALFTRAHAISPNARTLRGIGMTSFEMRDYAEAYRALSAALVETARPLTPDQIVEARALLERTSGFLGVFRVEVVPAGATLLVDGHAAVTADDGRVLLGLGRHELVARATGYGDAQRAIDVRGGESETISVRLEPDASAHDLPPPATSDAGDVAPQVDARGSGASDPTAGIALLVSGGVLSVAALVVGLASWRTSDEQIALCQAAGPDCDNLGGLRGERDAAAGITIALAVGGVGLLAIGAIVLATSGGDARGTASIACAPGLGGVFCSGRF